NAGSDLKAAEHTYKNKEKALIFKMVSFKTTLGRALCTWRPCHGNSHTLRPHLSQRPVCHVGNRPGDRTQGAFAKAAR
ncbi:hypothetical protein, partial [Variovorax sp. HJSM1_2]|uniref:hypothetical protein n=1 Tax=Variovorax sp. HJSM1_2 TaxID=3366263 RepID=UPI003BED28FF